MNNGNFLLYEKIADILRKRILEDGYPVNTRMPSEEVLAKELSVSRPTIKKAVSLLEKEGLIQCRAAVGSFVRRKPTARNLIGYIAPSLNDPFHSDVTRELDKVVNTMNSSLMVGEGGFATAQTLNAVERLKESGATGIILSAGAGVRWQDIQSCNIPVVWCGGVPDTNAVDRITLNQKTGIRMIMDHLVSQGIKSVGYALGEKISFAKDPRFQAFQEYVQTHSLQTKKAWHKSVNILGEEGGRQLMRLFKRLGKLPQAIVCYNDWTAIGLIREALDANIKVPEKLKVTGFDNLFISRYFHVPLTTVDYRIPELIKKAVQMLLRRIDNPARSPESIFLEGELVVRKSTLKE
jgi:DNA-binding LacI/PurR family transcriptional regulator